MALDPCQSVNLTRVSVLALEQSTFSFKILAQALRGFGVREVLNAQDGKTAEDIVKFQAIDLLIADPQFDRGNGLEFLRWLRRETANQNRFVPTILMSGHSTMGMVTLARNSGANFCVAKPFTPAALLARILWVARDQRPFVEIGDYVGPSRRFRHGGAPLGPDGRVRDRRAGRAKPASQEAAKQAAPALERAPESAPKQPSQDQQQADAAPREGEPIRAAG